MNYVQTESVHRMNWRLMLMGASSTQRIPRVKSTPKVFPDWLYLSYSSWSVIYLSYSVDPESITPVLSQSGNPFHSQCSIWYVNSGGAADGRSMLGCNLSSFFRWLQRRWRWRPNLSRGQLKVWSLSSIVKWLACKEPVGIRIQVNIVETSCSWSKIVLGMLVFWFLLVSQAQ